MSKKYVEICSIDFRAFMQVVVELANKGAKFTKECPAFKNPTSRVKLEVPENLVIEANPLIRILPKEKVQESAKLSTKVEVSVKKEDEVYSVSELENMSLKELRTNTGITSGKNKQDIIKEYFEKQEKTTEADTKNEGVIVEGDKSSEGNTSE